MSGLENSLSSSRPLPVSALYWQSASLWSLSGSAERRWGEGWGWGCSREGQAGLRGYTAPLTSPPFAPAPRAHSPASSSFPSCLWDNSHLQSYNTCHSSTSLALPLLRMPPNKRPQFDPQSRQKLIQSGDLNLFRWADQRPQTRHIQFTNPKVRQKHELSSSFSCFFLFLNRSQVN